ncbi:hypothetical protein FEM48_Zijuj02G0108200 [Ziziphus jujuba var. spinosa]|uniref:DUF7870 domain-containing protein n=1 Tax=Ziziphus jujuba var. spinosa TaxID=714518 RepID=A0A978VVA8_ZIZJJ|nr:hypothetical protein FEM48_Zijuj02G0108200 [Ziziphus jujuba var. spinosa]
MSRTKSETEMEFASGYRANDEKKIKHVHNGSMGLNSQNLLVIKLPDLRLLCVMSRSVLLALVILTMPLTLSILKESMEPVSYAESNTFNFEQLDLLLHGLAEDGVLRKVDKALIVCPSVADVIPNLRVFDGYGIDMVMDSDLERQSSFIDGEFDFVFTSNLSDVKFVDRIVKIGGIVAVSPSNELSNAFIEKGNFKFLFVRQFISIPIMAMRKIGGSSSTKRRLCQSSREVRKAVLKGLEDVLLEPPRQALKNSRNYSRKIKFLPHLLGASLEAFRRRVFVNSGLPEQKKVVTDWFHKHYPKMKQDFEVYHLDEVPEEATSMVAEFQNDISDWLLKNVGEDDYVVMKAEAGLVEEMIEKGTIHLVDELFLECKNQWWQVGKKSKRAYWECLALYGRLRDEGVAVHQWWG